MTLIVTYTSPLFTLMVTDRLVTSNGIMYDPDANKNILFADRNAVVAIGYTGMAYIEKFPRTNGLSRHLRNLLCRLAELRGESQLSFHKTTSLST